MRSSSPTCTRKLEILFLDNLTTSFCYMDRPISEQSIASKAIKELAIKHNIPIVVIAHTGADITENFPQMIEMNHIRGSKTIVNLAEFFYILQSFYVGTERHNILRISKHRGQEVSDRLYKLYYYSKFRLFGKDEILAFGALKEIFKQRNRL